MTKFGSPFYNDNTHKDTHIQDVLHHTPPNAIATAYFPPKKAPETGESVAYKCLRVPNKKIFAYICSVKLSKKLYSNKI